MEEIGGMLERVLDTHIRGKKNPDSGSQYPCSLRLRSAVGRDENSNAYYSTDHICKLAKANAN